MTIDRRSLLVGGAVAAGGGVFYSRGLAAMLADGQNGSGDAVLQMLDRKAYIAQDINIFSAVKRKLVAAMSETVLPRTDTPGAIDAGVPKFLELLYAQWMAPAEQALFDQGLKTADQQARMAHDKPFEDCDDDDRKSILEKMEEEHGTHSWFAFGGESVSDTQADIPFMALFKEITVTGFFMSEVGAKQVLRYEMMPGRFDGDTELESADSSWAAVPLM